MQTVPATTSRLATLPQAAHYLQVSLRTVHNLIRRGRISTVRIAGIRRVFVPIAELEALTGTSRQKE